MKKKLTLLFLIPIFLLTGCLSDYVQKLVGEDVYTDHTPFKQYFSDYGEDLHKEFEEGSKKYDEEAKKVLEKTKLGYTNDELAFFIPNEYDRESINNFEFIEHKNVGNTNYLVYAYQARIKSTDRLVSVLYQFDYINRKGETLYLEEHDMMGANKFLVKKTETLVDEESIYEVLDDFKLLVINNDGEILAICDMRDTFYNLADNYEEARSNSIDFAKKTNELVRDKIGIEDFVLDRYGNVYFTIYKITNTNFSTEVVNIASNSVMIDVELDENGKIKNAAELDTEDVEDKEEYLDEIGVDSNDDIELGDEDYTTICCYNVTKQELLLDRKLVKIVKYENNDKVIYAPFNVYYTIDGKMIDDSRHVCYVNGEGVYGVKKIKEGNREVGTELYFVSDNNYNNSSVHGNAKIRNVEWNDLFSNLNVENYIKDMTEKGTINDYANKKKLENDEYYYCYSLDYEGDYFEEMPNLVEEVSDEFNENKDFDLFDEKKKIIVQDYQNGKYVYFNSCNNETWDENRIFQGRPSNYLFTIEPKMKYEMLESTGFGYGVLNNDADSKKLRFNFKYLDNDELNYNKIVEDDNNEYKANNDSDFKEYNLNIDVNDDFIDFKCDVKYKSHYEITLMYKDKVRILRYDKKNKIFDETLNYNDLFLINGATGTNKIDYDVVNVSWTSKDQIVLSSYMFGTVLYNFDESLAYRLDDCAVYAAYLDESGELFCIGTKLGKQVLYVDTISLTYFQIDLSTNNYIQSTIHEMLRDSKDYVEQRLYNIDFYNEFDSFLVKQKATASIVAKKTLENVTLLVKRYKNDIELLNYYMNETRDSEKETMFYDIYNLENYIDVRKYYLNKYSVKYPKSLESEKVVDTFSDSYMNQLAQEGNAENAILDYIVSRENDARGVFEIESEIGVEIEVFTVEEFVEILQKTSDHVRDIKNVLKNVEN